MTRRLPFALVLALLTAVALLGSTPASAVSHDVPVQLSGTGPSPAAVTIAVGDRVLFVNVDSLDHEVKGTGASRFVVQVPANGKAATPLFVAAGTYPYTDSRLTLAGSIQDVPAKITAGATPTASGSPAPAGSAAPSPGTSASAAPGSSPAPAGPPPAGTGGSGTAVPPLLPGFLGGILPTVGPVPLTGPAPAVAPPAPGASGSASSPGGTVAGPGGGTGSATQGGGSLAQRSPGRHYGLPGALAVVAIVGLSTLLVRVLLAEPAAQRRELRAGPAAAATVD